MHEDKFNNILRHRVERMGATLTQKAAEYATNNDRLHNFKVASTLINGTSEQACWGFLAKHLVSIQDLVFSNTKVPRTVIDEKIGDAINYLVLLEAIMLEKYETP